MSSDTESAPARVKVDLGQPAPAMTHWNKIDELREEHRFFWAERGPGLLGAHPRTRTSARRSRRPRCSATTRSCRPIPIRRTASCPRSPTRRSTWPTAAR